VETQNASGTTHLLALMKKGDDAFNARDFTAMKAVHHPQMAVHIAGSSDGRRSRDWCACENFGFSPIKPGGLSEGGLLVQARGNTWGRLILKDLVKFD